MDSAARRSSDKNVSSHVYTRNSKDLVLSVDLSRHPVLVLGTCQLTALYILKVLYMQTIE